MGVVIGEPTLSLSAAHASTNPQLAADLQWQRARLQHDLNSYARVYPVFSTGLSFRF